jgi:hypothetical protein
VKKKPGNNHYTFAVRLCISAVGARRKKHGITVPIEYVRDRFPKGQGTIGDIKAAFQLAATDGIYSLREYGLMPLQNEDAWALTVKTQLFTCRVPTFAPTRTRNCLRKLRTQTNRLRVCRNMGRNSLPQDTVGAAHDPFGYLFSDSTSLSSSAPVSNVSFDQHAAHMLVLRVTRPYRTKVKVPILAAKNALGWGSLRLLFTPPRDRDEVRACPSYTAFSRLRRCGLHSWPYTEPQWIRPCWSRRRDSDARESHWPGHS